MIERHRQVEGMCQLLRQDDAFLTALPGLVGIPQGPEIQGQPGETGCPRVLRSASLQQYEVLRELCGGYGRPLL